MTPGSRQNRWVGVTWQLEGAGRGPKAAAASPATAQPTGLALADAASSTASASASSTAPAKVIQKKVPRAKPAQNAGQQKFTLSWMGGMKRPSAKKRPKAG